MLSEHTSNRSRSEARKQETATQAPLAEILDKLADRDASTPLSDEDRDGLVKALLVETARDLEQTSKRVEKATEKARELPWYAAAVY